MGTPKRMHEVVNVCLETFMEKGLAHTSTRDLCNALNLNSGGIFWYFKTKDEAIIACAEEAAIRIEKDLFGIAFEDLRNPEKLARDLHDRALAMRPLMDFFVSVCTTRRYEEALKEPLDRLSERYKYYCNHFAECLSCTSEEVAPYVYIAINTMLSFMVFGNEDFNAPQLDLVYEAIHHLLKKQINKTEGGKY